MLGIVELGYNMPRDVTPNPTPTSVCAHEPKKKNEEMEETICHLYVSIIKESQGYDILLHPLLVAILSMQVVMKNLKSELDLVLLRPI